MDEADRRSGRIERDIRRDRRRAAAAGRSSPVPASMTLPPPAAYAASQRRVASRHVRHARHHDQPVSTPFGFRQRLVVDEIERMAGVQNRRDDRRADEVADAGEQVQIAAATPA